MGSPFEYTISSRVHTVTTDRGASMILNKILTAAAGYERETQRELCFEIISTLRLDPLAYERSAKGIEEFDLFNRLAEPDNLWVPLQGYLEAYLMSNSLCSRIVLSCGARYAWRGFDKYECIVIFDTGLKPLRKEGFSVAKDDKRYPQLNVEIGLSLADSAEVSRRLREKLDEVLSRNR